MASFSWFVRDLIAEANEQRLGNTPTELKDTHTDVVRQALKTPLRAVVLAGLTPEARRTFIYEIAKLRMRIASEDPNLAFGIVEINLAEFHQEREGRQQDIDDFYHFLRKNPEVIVYLDHLDPYLEPGSDKGNFNYACSVIAGAIRNQEIPCIAGLSSDKMLMGLRGNPNWRDHINVVDSGAGCARDVLAHLIRCHTAIAEGHAVSIAPTAIGAAATLTRELMPKSRWTEQAESILDQACERYKGKMQAKESYPDMLDQASMERLTDKVGAYDVMRVVEEKVGISISKSAQDWMQRMRASLTDHFSTQNRAIGTAVLAAANIRMGVRNPLGPAGGVVVVGSEAQLRSAFAKGFIQSLVKSESDIRAVDFSVLGDATSVQDLIEKGGLRAIIPPNQDDQLSALRVRNGEAADRSAFDMLYRDLTGGYPGGLVDGISPWFSTVVVIQIAAAPEILHNAEQLRAHVEACIGPDLATMCGMPIVLQ